MADTLPWFQFFWNDWLTGTRTMTHEAKGIYMDLLCHSWDKGPLSKDAAVVARFAGMPRARFRRIWDEQIACKWIEIDTGFVNSKLEQIRSELGAFQKSQSDKAAKRWNKHAGASAVAVPGDMPGESYLQPHSHSQNEDQTLPPSAFDDVWVLYPNKAGKQAALKAWRKLHPTPGIFNAIGRALSWQTKSEKWTKDGGQFVPHLSTYLNGRRWEDEPPVASRPRTLGPSTRQAAWEIACERDHDCACPGERAHAERMARERVATS